MDRYCIDLSRIPVDKIDWLLLVIIENKTKLMCLL